MTVLEAATMMVSTHLGGASGAAWYNRHSGRVDGGPRRRLGRTAELHRRVTQFSRSTGTRHDTMLKSYSPARVVLSEDHADPRHMTRLGADWGNFGGVGGSVEWRRTSVFRGMLHGAGGTCIHR